MATLIDEVFEKAGGRHVLQDELHLSKQTMSDWKRWGHVPARHAVAVEKLTGIPRERLCPDFEWGRAHDNACSAAHIAGPTYRGPDRRKAKT